MCVCERDGGGGDVCLLHRPEGNNSLFVGFLLFHTRFFVIVLNYLLVCGLLVFIYLLVFLLLSRRLSASLSRHNGFFVQFAGEKVTQSM